jgi:hypothetical protein
VLPRPAEAAIKAAAVAGIAAVAGMTRREPVTELNPVQIVRTESRISGKAI